MRDKALRDAREEKEELEALHRLDEECVHQQRAGNYLKAFDCMERALVLRRHFFGIESEEVIQACRALAEMCNLLAMSFLQKDNYAVTIDLLKKAEVLTQRHHPAERATTLNNLACYYRRLGKLHSAMTSLKRALEVEKRLENVRNAADTQLNMCAVLSQLGKHQEALEHAQEALITLQEGFIQGKHTTESATTDATTGDATSARLDRISVMCIAYHNIGVEQEFLKDYAESVVSYKKGVGLAEQYLGADHSITTTIRNTYLAAKRTMATKARVRPCSATRGQNSPGKTGARLLLSPRSGSLRMPSPLAKEKGRQNGSQIPTPRSIIADALSRSPLSSLPPLEIQSPPSAGKKKKKKADASEANSAAPPMSPTDPFFSPRFRFESDSSEPKTKKLAGITSPRSLIAVKVGTPASSKEKRERRKSSVKKPPMTAETSERAAKSSADERMKTEPSPGSNEADLNERAIASQDAKEGAHSDSRSDDIPPQSEGIQIDEPAVQGITVLDALAGETNVSLNTRALDELTHNGIVAPESTPTSDHQNESAIATSFALNEGQSSERSEVGESLVHSEGLEYHDQAIDRAAISTRRINEDNADPGAESVEATISMLLANVVEQIAEKDMTRLANATSVEDDDTRVQLLPEQTISDEQFDEHPTGSLSIDDTGELNSETHDSDEAPDIVEVDQESNPVSVNDYETPAAVILEETFDASAPREDTMLTPELFADTEGARTEEDYHTIADEAIEPNSVDEGSTNAECAVKEVYGDDVVELDDTCHLDNTETEEVNELSPNAEPEEAIASNEATDVTEEEHREVEVVTEAVTDNYAINYELHTYEVPVDDALPSFDLPEIEPTTRSIDLGEQGGDDQLGVEEWGTGLIDGTQQLYDAEDGGGRGHYENNYTLTEPTAPEVEASAEDFHQGEEDTENCLLEPELVEQTEPIAIDYEQPSHEDVEPLGDVEQDWSHADRIEASDTAAEGAADYSDYYEDPSVLAHVEQVAYDEPAVAADYFSGQLHEDVSSDLHASELSPNQSTAAAE